MTRAALIRKVHVGKRALGLDEDTYRDLLERVTGKRSAADCDARELSLVVGEMTARGFHVKQKGPQAAQDGPPQLAKMRAIWITLWCLREVRSRNDKALLAFVRRQTGQATGALHWITPAQANAVIEALKDWCARAGFEVPENGMAAKRQLAARLRAELAEEGYDPPVTGADIARLRAAELDEASMAMRQLLGRRWAKGDGGRESGKGDDA